MTEGNLLWIILSIAAPITAANLAQSLHHIINAFFIGKLGADPIAAVAACVPVIGVLISFGAGLSTAGAILVAQNTGANQFRMASYSAAQTLLMVSVVAFGFAALGYYVTPLLLGWIGVSENVFDLAWDYLKIAYIGMVPIFGFLTLQAMLQSAGEVKFAMLVMIGAVVLNTALDPILIFGVGSWPGWGVQGAAAATVLSQSLAFLFLLRHVTRGHSVLHVKHDDFRPDLAFFRKAFSIGFPSSIETGSRTLGSLLLMSLAAAFGTVTLAAYGIGIRLILFWFAPMIGLSIATSAVIGQNIGAGKVVRAETAAKLSAWLAMVGFTVIGLLHLPFLPHIMSALAPGEHAVIDVAVVFATICFPFFGFFAATQVINGAFRGGGSTKLAMVISLAMQYGFQIPFAWGLVHYFGWDSRAIWWSYPVSNVAATLLCVYFLRRGNWRKNLVSTDSVAAVESL